LKKIIPTIIFLCFVSTYSQKAELYSYLNKAEISVLQKQIKEKIKTKIDNISSKKKREKKKALKNAFKFFEHALNDSLYINQPKLNEIIDDVVENICKTNSDLESSKIKFLLKHNYIPNAASYGFNLFEINLGLFALLESEDELAFIICHELAHQQLLHFDKTIENKNKLNIKDDSKNKKLKTLIFKHYHNSKKQEIEADSLGYLYFKNTKYNLQAAQSALNKLGAIEEILYSQNINWKKTFNYDYNTIATNSPILNQRVIDQDFLMEEDSIRSHPHIKSRLKKLNYLYIKTSNNRLNKTQLLAIHTYLEFAKKHNKIAELLYLNNKMHTLYPYNKIYSHNFIALIDQIYSLKKQHKLGKYVLQKNIYSKEKFMNEIRNFLHEIELFQLKQIKQHLSN